MDLTTAIGDLKEHTCTVVADAQDPLGMRVVNTCRLCGLSIAPGVNHVLVASNVPAHEWTPD